MARKLTKKRALELTALANADLENFADHIIELFEGKAHEVLGTVLGEPTTKKGEIVADALLESLPGGTLDWMIVRLLERYASRLRVGWPS